MDSVLWLAKIFGPFYLVMGLWTYFRSDDVQRLWNSVKHTPLFTLGAVLNLLIGFTILSTYNSWTLGIPLLLTITGYLMVLRGVAVLFAPEKIIVYTEKIMTYGKNLSFIPMVIGALLIYFAVRA